MRRITFFFSLFLSLLSVALVSAQDATISLVPYRDELYAVQSVVPDGWKAVGNGLTMRQSSAADTALVALQAAPISAEVVLKSMLPQLGLTAPPESIGEQTTAAFTWTLYQVDVQGVVRVDFGLAEANNKTYIIFMQASNEEYDALHKAVFLPMLEATAPIESEVSAEPVPYSAEEVTIPSGDHTLAGTLTLPEGAGKHPVVVLVSGSGAQDRDESLAPAAAIKPFALIADYLTRNGIAVLRYDDRGVGASTGDFASATTFDFANDAAAAIEYLTTRPDIDAAQIGLMGHSEGGLVAAILGANNPHLAFVISMAGPGVNGLDVLVEQNRAIMIAEGTPEADMNVQVDFLKQGLPLVVTGDEAGFRALADQAIRAGIETMSEEDRTKIGDIEAFVSKQIEDTVASFFSPWFKTFLGYDPAPDWERVQIPVLALFGGLDVQVVATQNAPALEASLKAGGNADYTIITLPDANHLFQAATTGAVSEYGKLEAAFTADFLPKLTEWLLKHVKVAG